MTALQSIGTLGTIALLIFCIALIIAPLKIWDHLRQLRKESRAAAKQSREDTRALAKQLHNDAQSLLAAITDLTNALYSTPES